jgi:hypothetical protein
MSDLYGFHNLMVLSPEPVSIWLPSLENLTTKKDKQELEQLKAKHLLVGDGKIDKDLKLFVERDE